VFGGPATHSAEASLVSTPEQRVKRVIPGVALSSRFVDCIYNTVRGFQVRKWENPLHLTQLYRGLYELTE
jgi:hypothetical protein